MIRTLLKGLALVLLLALAVSVRLVGYDRIIDPPQTHLIAPDSHLHAWRMIRAAEAFPGLAPWREDRLAHPEGVVMGWPPGLDYAGGALARLDGAVDAPGEGVARAGTLLVVALGALTVLVAFALARRFVGFGWALLGGLFLALWPLHIEYTRVGRVDHHVLEPLITALAALALMRALEAGRRWWLHAALTGVLLGLAIWCWPTALFCVAMLGLALLLVTLLGRAPRPILPVAAATAAAVAAPLCLAPPFRGTWTLHAPSGLHLLILGALGLAGLTVHLLRPRLARAALSPRARSVALGLGAAAALLLPLLAVPAAEAFKLALTFGGRGGLWGGILEQRPLYALPFLHISLLLTYLVLPLPLLALAALRAPVPAGRRLSLQVLGLLAGAFWLLGLWQLRFIPLGLVLGAPLAAVGLHQLVGALRRRLDGRVQPALLRSLGPAAALASLTLLWPAADYLSGRLYLPMGRHIAVEQAARWLRARRPHAAGQRMAVMTSLAEGNPVLHLGRVAVVASALVDPSTEAATRDSLIFYTTTDHEEARRVLRRRGVTHVVSAYQPAPRLRRFLRHLGRPSSWAVVDRQHRNSVATRLHLDSGSGFAKGKIVLAAIPWLQHRWENGGPYAPPNVEAIQVFRIVEGARLTGTAGPGERVEVSLPLLTSGGRPLRYRDRVHADAAGRFELRVPYWTDPRPPPAVLRYLRALENRNIVKDFQIDSTIALGPARVTSATLAATVQIGRQAVERGATIRVLPAARVDDKAP